MANFGPIQIYAIVSNLKTFPELTRFLSAFTEQVKTNFNGLIATREIYGSIGATGAILSGDGFGCSFVSTGNYFLKFVTPFSDTPSVFLTPGIANRIGYQAGVTLGSAIISFTDLSVGAVAANSRFNFLIKGTR